MSMLLLTRYNMMFKKIIKFIIPVIGLTGATALSFTDILVKLGLPGWASAGIIALVGGLGALGIVLVMLYTFTQSNKFELWISQKEIEWSFTRKTAGLRFSQRGSSHPLLHKFWESSVEPLFEVIVKTGTRLWIAYWNPFFEGADSDDTIDD